MRSFQSNFNFDKKENRLAGWQWSQGSLESVCSSWSYTGQCHAVLHSNPGKRAAIWFDERPSPAEIAQKGVYSEWAVRCPSNLNGSDCRVRLIIAGLDAAGNWTDSFVTGWRTIKRDDRWRLTKITMDRFASDTVKWRFRLRVDAGDDVAIDSTQQSYHHG